MKLTMRDWTAIGAIAAVVMALVAVFTLIKGPQVGDVGSERDVIAQERGETTGSANLGKSSAEKVGARPEGQAATPKLARPATSAVRRMPSPAPSDPAPAAPPPTSGRLVEAPEWARKPSDEEVRYAYPEAAKALRLTAKVVLACEVEIDMTVINCIVEESSTPGYGFEDAALRLTRKFRLHPQYEDNVAIARAKVRIPINFKPA